MTRRWLALAVVLCAAGARASDGYAIDVRGATYAQLFNRALLPGASGAVVRPETLAAFYGTAFLRVTGLDTPWQRDAVSAELSAWGALGGLPQPVGAVADGDVLAAWVQHRSTALTVKVGRQVTLPGAARYARFDGLLLGTRAGPVELEAWAGLVALPRWNRPRGYWVLGSMADALKDPSLLEAQSRMGQWLAGARASLVSVPGLRASVAFHEQRDGVGLAFRNVAVDALLTKLAPVAVGGRVVMDLVALAPAEARLWADVTALPTLPLSVDYAYQAPALLLPATSVLAAFGGGAWHEAGAEASWRPHAGLRLTARGAGQLYEAGLPGGRGSLRAQWTPDQLERWLLIGEYARVATAANGYHQLRAAARFRLASFLVASADASGWLYDVPVRGAPASGVALGSLEYVLRPGLRFLVSGSVTTSPFAALDAQAMARAVFEPAASSSGGSW